MIWLPEDVQNFAPQMAACILTLPDGFGRITALNVRNGKVVASTESGVSMIVHKEKTAECS